MSYLSFSSRKTIQFFNFSTQLLLKIPAFELKNRFIFHQIWAADIELILGFLKVIHDFLACSSTVRSPVYIFPRFGGSGVCVRSKEKEKKHSRMQGKWTNLENFPSQERKQKQKSLLTSIIRQEKKRWKNKRPGEGTGWEASSDRPGKVTTRLDHCALSIFIK